MRDLLVHAKCLSIAAIASAGVRPVALSRFALSRLRGSTAMTMIITWQATLRDCAGLLAFEEPFRFGNLGFRPHESLLSAFFGMINEHAMHLPHRIRLRFATFYVRQRQPTAQNDSLVADDGASIL